jgi:hypothetical protein
MSDYSQSIDFSAKDALATGDANKVAKGADIDTELDLISTAIATKFDSNDLASQAQAEAGASSSVLMSPLRVEQWSAVWAAENAGIIGDLQALADPAADVLFGWDDGTNAALSYTAGTGIALGSDQVSLSFLGLESLTDPNVDALVYWDDSDGALNWLAVDNGITIDSDDTIGLTDAAVSATIPISVTTGVIDFDISSLTTITGAGLAGADLFYVDDGAGGTSKALAYQDMAIPLTDKVDAYTFVLADANQIFTMNNAATKAFTIPANASVAYPIGTTLTMIWITGAGVPTVAITSDTLVAPNGTSLAQAGSVAVAIKVAATTWVLSGDTV